MLSCSVLFIVMAMVDIANGNDSEVAEMDNKLTQINEEKSMGEEPMESLLANIKQ